MNILGLPLDTALVLLVMMLLPVATYTLYRIELRRVGGPGSVLGVSERSSDNA